MSYKYNNKIGVVRRLMPDDPRIWGPDVWQTVHHLTYTYPIHPTLKDKQKAKTFFMSLGNKLPCDTCGDSYEQFLKRMPIDAYLDTRYSLSYWGYKMHCMVNDKLRRQGKLRNADPTYNDVCRKYDNLCF